MNWSLKISVSSVNILSVFIIEAGGGHSKTDIAGENIKAFSSMWSL